MQKVIVQKGEHNYFNVLK